MPAPLDPFQPTPSKPWSAERVIHLHRRVGFGASFQDVESALTKSPAQHVNDLFDGMKSKPLPGDPYWANWTWLDYDDDNDLFNDHYETVIEDWVKAMASGDLRSKIALFWHNHFVTEWETYTCTNYQWSYFKLLMQYAIGNFREFVEKMGKNAAMLVYLNGNQNRKNEPNENYARELMELFTMGEGNGYTQADIPEVAKALTGYYANMYDCLPSGFDADDFNNGAKNVFGQIGNWNYDDVHELIFTRKADQVAHYICTKIYKHFVYQQVDEQVVLALATTFKDNNWDLEPVFRQLFQSEHFFEQDFIGAHIKSPVEVFVTTVKTAGLDVVEDLDVGFAGSVSYWSSLLGQELFEPVDVAGWPGHHAWLNENTLTNRWSLSGDLLYRYFADSESARTKLQALAVDLANPVINDPVIITEAICNHFLSRTLEGDLLATAVQYFKGDIPENYYDDGSWNLYWNEAPYQILNLLSFLSRLPEWQLT
ncbi:MAG: DUF1800 domain-containing protein [Saprospiraceae bacterium]|nr:DUF1800 domain-containing protein [Saprospiraceae bacterium]